MLSLDALPIPTKDLFSTIVAANKDGLLDDMLLVGGTALAMRVGHRKSEDIDFATGAMKLPVKKISALIKNLESSGHKIIDITDQSARDDFTNDGLEIENYQQDWLVDETRLTFFTHGENDYERDTINTAEFDVFNGIRVSSIAAIAKIKCHVVTRRTKSRDLFDINFLVESGYITIGDVIAEMQRNNPHMIYETAVYYLTEKPIQKNDEGLLPTGVNVTVEQIRLNIMEKIKLLESDIAREYKQI